MASDITLDRIQFVICIGSSLLGNDQLQGRFLIDLYLERLGRLVVSSLLLSDALLDRGMDHMEVV